MSDKEPEEQQNIVVEVDEKPKTRKPRKALSPEDAEKRNKILAEGRAKAHAMLRKQKLPAKEAKLKKLQEEIDSVKEPKTDKKEIKVNDEPEPETVVVRKPNTRKQKKVVYVEESSSSSEEEVIVRRKKKSSSRPAPAPAPAPAPPPPPPRQVFTKEQIEQRRKEQAEKIKKQKQQDNYMKSLFG